MCSISGIINYNNSIENISSVLDKMSNILIHRGQDSIKKYIDNNIYGVVHNRLSIIDLISGDQPFNTDRYSIAFNGEIYNFLDLKKNINYNFITNSDTEVILAYYIKYKEKCVNYLNGMFAFVIWDNIEKTLFCARDRIGIKPFYYAQFNNNFYFASEAKALLSFIPAAVNTKKLIEYFSFQFNIGENTLFNNVKQLLPGHYMVIESNKNIIQTEYWDFNISSNNLLESDIINKLNLLLDNSIKSHLIGDVKIGSYLSGGIDSSSIATHATKYINELNCFHGKFNVDGYTEYNYAKKIADNKNIILHHIEINSSDFINNINDIIYHLDFPVAGPGSFPQYMTSKLVRNHNIKVVLGGQGGDELFGGYTRYIIANLENQLKNSINTNDVLHIYNLNKIKNYIPLLQEFWQNNLFSNPESRYYSLILRNKSLVNIILPELINSSDIYDEYKNIFNHSESDYINKMLYFDLKTSLPALLHVEDRMSMAHTIESRVPFIEHNLIEFLFSVSGQLKIKNNDAKYLLKQTIGKNLPNEILNRPDKMGFPVPLNIWFKNELKEYIFDTFKSQTAKQRFYLNPNFNIENLISNNTAFDRSIWALLSLELWQQLYIDK